VSSSLNAYRIVKRRWASSAFDGEGARLYGGRWNSKGQSCVYLSSSLSLAALEMLVHLDAEHLLSAYCAFVLPIPHSQLRQLQPEDLPDNWREHPAPAETARLGDAWLASGDGMALLLPSAVLPSENNLLLNTRHPAFAQCSKQAQEIPFAFDHRLK